MAEITDDLLRGIFGSPVQAAADLNELRVWTHGRTSLQPTAGSASARETIADLDPTWPARALTNERIILPDNRRPRGYGISVRVAESTIEAMSVVAAGREAPSTRTRGSKLFETLWPAQACSWQTWVFQAMDMGEVDDPQMRRHHAGLKLPYIHPALFQMMVLQPQTPYLREVYDAMHSIIEPSYWKFGSILFNGDLWAMGLHGFHREWLDRFDGGELALWLRSAVCNGWFTSGSLASYMGLETARSCKEGWIS